MKEAERRVKNIRFFI